MHLPRLALGLCNVQHMQCLHICNTLLLFQGQGSCTGCGLPYCTGMTINKAQGQTLRMAGLYLPSQPFSHGQLYVAKTRVGSRNALRVVAKCGKVRGWEGVHVQNVVHKELLLR